MLKIMYACIAVAVAAGLLGIIVVQRADAPQTIVPEPEAVMCTMDARQCPDGSYVGRTGPQCEFVCPELPALSPEAEAQITAKADLITVSNPVPLSIIENGITVRGKARGSWYFEGSFPIVVTTMAGDIIAQGVATAVGDWMTADFVPFTSTLSFTSPYTEGSSESVKFGTLLLKKDNPSGLAENDDMLQIPVRFAP